MNHWIIAPVLLPAVLAAVQTLTMRHHPLLQRVFSLAGVVAVLAVALGLTLHAATGAIEVYELGNWPAPFGIVLVLDRLSALMVLLTAVLAGLVLLYAIGSGWDQRGNNFHPLFQFQLMGIFGAFLTGDAFNLFVFFEVLLIASYGLMIHAGGARRLKAGVQYVIYNLLGSTLFLFALGTLYAVTGTLNMADLAVRAAEIPVEDSALLRVGAMLLFLVFAIKAALLPLHFWLPETYAEAPAPVAALFAIMTKVGAYAILRMYTLVFGPDLGATADLIDNMMIYAALITIAAGMIGILGRQAPRAAGGLRLHRFDGHAADRHRGLSPRDYGGGDLLYATFHLCRGAPLPRRRSGARTAQRDGRCATTRPAHGTAWAHRSPVLWRGDCIGGHAAAFGLYRQALGARCGARHGRSLADLGGDPRHLARRDLGLCAGGQHSFLETRPGDG